MQEFAARAVSTNGGTWRLPRPRQYVGRLVKVVDRQGRIAGACSIEPPTRPVAEARRMVLCKPPAHRQIRFEIGRHGDRSRPDRPGIRQRLLAADRTFAVTRPREKASPALVVASASKSRAVRIRAEPASHGLGIQKRPSSMQGPEPPALLDLRRHGIWNAVDLLIVDRAATSVQSETCKVAGQDRGSSAVGPVQLLPRELPGP